VVAGERGEGGRGDFGFGVAGVEDEGVVKRELFAKPDDALGCGMLRWWMVSIVVVALLPRGRQMIVRVFYGFSVNFQGGVRICTRRCREISGINFEGCSENSAYFPRTIRI